MRQPIILILLVLAVLGAFGLYLSGGFAGDGASGPSAPTLAGAKPVSSDDDAAIDPVVASAGDSSSASRSDVGVGSAALRLRDGVEPRELQPVRVVGRVVDPSGAGIAQAAVHVRLTPDFGTMFGNRAGGRGGIGNIDFRAMAVRMRAPGRKVATTNDDGEFSFATGVPLGDQIEIAALRDGLAPASQTVRLTADGDEATAELRTDDIVLTGGTLIRGRVVDQQGAAVVSAVVDAAAGARGGFGRGGRGGRPDGGGGFAITLLPAVATDANGRFELRAVPSGEWRLNADADGYLPGRSDAIETGGDSAEPVEVQIEIKRGTPLHGRVVDAAGDPIADATVSVRSASDDRAAAGAPGGGRGRRQRGGWMNRMMGRDAVTATSGRDGTYAFDAVALGEVRIEVEHPRFMTAEREPVDASRTPAVDFVLEERLGVRGVVVDASTGEPIETFAIEAREIRERGNFRGRGRDETPDAVAAREAAEQQRQAYLRERIGGAGEPAGATPEPSAHPKGAFELSGLLPGKYALDVAAPGYVRVAVDIVELDAASRVIEVTLRVQRGTVVRGVVVGTNGEPIANARITVRVPEPPAAPEPATADPVGAQRGAVRAIFGGGRRGPRGTQVADARTAEDGSFQLAPLLGGRYLVDVQKRDTPDLEDQELFVAQDRDEMETRLVMSSGTRIYGRVLGFEPGERLRVTFTRVDTGTQVAARVDRATGDYEIEGLEAGGYFVEAEEGRGGGDGRAGGGRRAGGGGFAARMQAIAGRPPHLTLVEGASEIRYDVARAALDVGTVAGTVVQNGGPGTGLQVTLKKVEDPNAPVEQGAPEQRMLQRIASRLMSARVDAEGRFEIDDLLPGVYELEVTAGGGGGRRGGGGGSGSLHSEQIVVRAASETSVRISVTTASAKFVLQAADGGEINPRGTQVSLVATADAGTLRPDQWNDLPSFQRVRLRGVEATASLTSGTYLYAVTGIGVSTVVDTFVVGAGQEARIDVRVAKRTGSSTVAEFDADGDGKLSREELPRQFRFFSQMLDTDGDGMSTAAEIDAALATIAATPRAGGPATPGAGRGGRQNGGGRGR